MTIDDYTLPFVVITNASNSASSVVLMQNHRAIAIDSKKAWGVQMHYPIYDKEFLAIV